MISHNAKGASTGTVGNGSDPPAQMLLLPGPINFVNHFNLYALSGLLHDAYLIGIDTETKPTFRKGEYHRTSILQLAIRTNADIESTVIVDLMGFGSDEKLRDLNDVLTPVMQSPTIIKIGQGLNQDFKEIYVAYPGLSAVMAVNGVIEVNWIYRHLYPEIKQDISLKRLALIILNCNLSKAQQMSNWNLRPLSRFQSEYAVRDALILIRLFEVMIHLASESGDFVIESLLGSLVDGKIIRS